MKTTQIENADDFIAFIGSLLNHKKSDLVAVDVETESFRDGKLPWELKLHGIGFYTPELHAFVWADAVDREELQRLLDCYTVLMHNATFDLHVLSALGVALDRVKAHDTLVMSHLADENCSHRLKDLAKSVLKKRSVVKYDDVGDRPEGGTLFADEDAKELAAWRKKMAEYCLDDCLYSYKLHGKLKERLESENLWSTYENVERPMVDIIRRMERTGIAVDSDYLKEIGKRCDTETDRSLTAVRDLVGDNEFNPGSSVQLSEYLFGEKGYELPEDFVTPAGKPSTNREALEWLVEHRKDRVSELVLGYRKYSKIKTTYVTGLLDKLRDGVLHGRFNQTGTATGRFSSSRPNMQNILCGEEGLDVRGAFVARPGHVFVINDYSQIELRVAAYFSDCATLIEAFKAGKDVHQATADKMGCERSVSKSINFGILYGMSAHGLARRMKINETAAEAFICAFFDGLPEISRFMSSCVAHLKKYGYVQTICGRRRRFPEYATALAKDDWSSIKKAERQAPNAAIQGSSADIIKLAMRRVDDVVRPYGGQLLLTVHDEVLVEVPEAEAERCVKDVQDCMENVIKLGDIPLVADPKSSRRWIK